LNSQVLALPKLGHSSSEGGNYEGSPTLWTFSQSFGRASILNSQVLALPKLGHSSSEGGNYEGSGSSGAIL
jgi:hypothetical protein